MTGAHSGSFYTVTDPVQARLLTDPKSKAFFKPFLARERSVAQAAELLGANVNTVLYRVKTLVRAGLLQVVDERRRAGRAIKLYRSAHDAYFIPFRHTPYATLEERLEVQAAPIFANLIQAYAAALRQSDRYGHHLLLNEHGVFTTSDLLPELSPRGLPVLYSDAVTQLSHEDARRVGHDLREVFERGVTAGRRGRGREESEARFLFMVAFLPIEHAQET